MERLLSFKARGVMLVITLHKCILEFLVGHATIVGVSAIVRRKMGPAQKLDNSE